MPTIYAAIDSHSRRERRRRLFTGRKLQEGAAGNKQFYPRIAAMRYLRLVFALTLIG
jgi:hypothetical protein